MLPRYTRPPFDQLWSEEAKFRRWLNVEMAIISARAKLDDLSPTIAGRIKNHFRFLEINSNVVWQIEAIEVELVHDMNAFIVAMRETMTGDLEPHRGEFHKGVTSYDIEDPAFILALRLAAGCILDNVRALHQALQKKSYEHRSTLMIGRTHGQYAVPDTFGRLLRTFAEALRKDIQAIERSVAYDLSEGKISGAIGNYGDMDPQIEELALAELGLQAAICETQILHRGRHFSFMAALARAAGTIAGMAKTFWPMMRSDVGELEEPRKSKQRGSSTMSQKKNPIKVEQMDDGIPRLFAGYLAAAFANIGSREGRDISQSIVERHIWPDATSLIYYMAETMTRVVDGLVVHADDMYQRLEVETRGVWAAERVRLALVDAGVDPNLAYDYTQAVSFEATKTKKQLYVLLQTRALKSDDHRTAYEILGEEKLVWCFDARGYVANGVKHIFGSDE
ncbi:MAG: hypothetical protein HY220_02450 [Candidatus Sungbacteria bacterium]|uniref:Fumarate lyase N-terminal domain-containing protein n=1 Tax=Candidatus Sungiibacteriota bacterium TaxID=2750080 RepID=A0A9D6LRV2_9BACT|nr:hypothetical protein [Candidatus Sungbacteria bacterium]